MSLLIPTISVNSLTDIDVNLLKNLNIKLVLLDVDNTLASHGSQEPFEGAIEWTYEVRKNNIQIVIVSNNFKSRVAPFAKKFDLPFTCLSFKPFPFCFNRAKKFIKNYQRDKTIVIGDQIFTDILGANLSHMKSILLNPKENDKETLGISLKRLLEKRIRNKINKMEVKKYEKKKCSSSFRS